jgi:hypothetical protein
MPATARLTRYAADRNGLICLLLDVRGQARQQSLQVYSYSKSKVVSLPRKLIRIETENAKRWAAVSVPRWLANAEGLHGKPEMPPVMSGFCRQQAADTRTDIQKRDDAERELAQYIVDRENRYRRLPGQRMGSFKKDRLNANIFA